MPELPEVETLKLGLQKYIVGKTIAGVEVRDPKLFEGPVNAIIGSKVTDVRRLAKGILIDLNNNYTIAVHIKLTGQLIYRNEKTKNLLVQKPSPHAVPNKFTRVVLGLAGRAKGTENSYLYFQEVRGFAWMKIVRTDKVRELPFFKTLGPEPIPSPGSNAPQLTKELFEKIVQSSNLPIKVLLMEQKKIGGVGNIYANEACFDASIDPRRQAKTLRTEEIEKLYTSLLKVLNLGIKYRGSSELNYVDVLGQAGAYQKHVKAYGRRGKSCFRCGGVFQKLYLGGRGTFFCNECQK